MPTSCAMMYKPVRPRPKKTDIIRSRTGCKGCRERRTKCDEQQPSCGTCTRLGKVCEKGQVEFKFRAVAVPSSQGSFQGNSQANTREHGELQSSHHDVSLIADIDTIKSLQHTERDIFYETHWEAICLPAVHPLFKSISSTAWKHPMLNDALLALSSCNLSRLEAELKRSSGKSMLSYGPNLVHQTRSQLYYSSAIKKFSSLHVTDYQRDKNLIFSVLIIFAYFESSMGNFQGFNCHMQGLTTFLMESHEVLGDKHLHDLLVAWQQVRYVVWWARVYFSSLEVQRGIPPASIPPFLEGCCDSIHERRVMALGIMCESHRLNFKEMLRHWSPQKELNADIERHRDTSALLAEEARKSDEWLLCLPESERPFESDVQNDSKAFVLFKSHDVALNYAYYVVGRIMQCTGSLECIHNQNCFHRERSGYAEDYWVRFLLGIARGTDMQASISKNSYTIGFSGLLLAAILRCQNLSLGIGIQEWLESLLRMRPTEEGAFPVYQTLGVVKVINQQRMMGHEVFGVTQPVDDGGGFPKFLCYNSQSITSLLLHGRIIASGKLFTESVSIDM